MADRIDRLVGRPERDEHAAPAGGNAMGSGQRPLRSRRQCLRLGHARPGRTRRKPYRPRPGRRSVHRRRAASRYFSGSRDAPMRTFMAGATSTALSIASKHGGGEVGTSRPPSCRGHVRRRRCNREKIGHLARRLDMADLRLVLEIEQIGEGLLAWENREKAASRIQRRLRSGPRARRRPFAQTLDELQRPERGDSASDDQKDALAVQHDAFLCLRSVHSTTPARCDRLLQNMADAALATSASTPIKCVRVLITRLRAGLRDPSALSSSSLKTRLGHFREGSAVRSAWRRASADRRRSAPEPRLRWPVQSARPRRAGFPTTRPPQARTRPAYSGSGQRAAGAFDHDHRSSAAPSSSGARLHVEDFDVLRQLSHCAMGISLAGRPMIGSPDRAQGLGELRDQMLCAARSPHRNGPRRRAYSRA